MKVTYTCCNTGVPLKGKLHNKNGVAKWCKTPTYVNVNVTKPGMQHCAAAQILNEHTQSVYSTDTHCRHFL